MNKMAFILIFLSILCFLCVSAGYGEARYEFELVTAMTYAEKTDHWSIDISVPEVRGMPDKAAQQELNAYFRAKGAEMIAGYRQSAAHAAESLAAGNSPSFTYQYCYDVVTDSDDFFVLRTTAYYISSSVTESSEYRTLDKVTGKLLDFSDVVKTSGEMADIRDQIFRDMLKFNRDAGAPVFRTDDSSLVDALAKAGEKHHWYFDENRRLIITFDKYEVGPAIVGSPEFAINHSTFFYMH